MEGMNSKIGATLFNGIGERFAQFGAIMQSSIWRGRCIIVAISQLLSSVTEDLVK